MLRRVDEVRQGADGGFAYAASGGVALLGVTALFAAAPAATPAAAPGAALPTLALLLLLLGIVGLRAVICLPHRRGGARWAPLGRRKGPAGALEEGL